MKKIATCITVIAALIGAPAFAADIAVKASPPAPAPVYNWTGWYAGVNAGASFGNVKTEFSAAPITLTARPLAFTTAGFADSNTEYPDGFIGGGQIGYNWQISPIWVVGLEADIQGALEKDSNNLNDPFNLFENSKLTGGPATVTGTAVTNYTTKIDWVGTVRARLGYLWGDGKVLSYVTGGLAYGKVDLEGTSTVSGIAGSFPPFSITYAIGHSHVNSGWVVGYGTEGKVLIPGWTYKIESLYIDLGSLDASSLTPGIASGIFMPTGGQVATHTHFRDAILRAGLNYQFH
jgi:outer membrane immunogenic protein